MVLFGPIWPLLSPLGHFFISISRYSRVPICQGEKVCEAEEDWKNQVNSHIYGGLFLHTYSTFLYLIENLSRFQNTTLIIMQLSL